MKDRVKSSGYCKIRYLARILCGFMKMLFALIIHGKSFYPFGFFAFLATMPFVAEDLQKDPAIFSRA